MKELVIKTQLGDNYRLSVQTVNGIKLINTTPNEILFDNGDNLLPADEMVAEVFRVKVKEPIVAEVGGAKIHYSKIFPIKHVEAVTIMNNIPKDTFLFASTITAKAFLSQKILVGKKLEGTIPFKYSAEHFFTIMN